MPRSSSTPSDRCAHARRTRTDHHRCRRFLRTNFRSRRLHPSNPHLHAPRSSAITPLPRNGLRCLLLHPQAPPGAAKKSPLLPRECLRTSRSLLRAQSCLCHRRPHPTSPQRLHIRFWAPTPRPPERHPLCPRCILASSRWRSRAEALVACPLSPHCHNLHLRPRSLRRHHRRRIGRRRGRRGRRFWNRCGKYQSCITWRARSSKTWSVSSCASRGFRDWCVCNFVFFFDVVCLGRRCSMPDVPSARSAGLDVGHPGIFRAMSG